ILLSNALISAHGYASPDVEDCYVRARELYHHTNDDGQIVPMLYGLWVNAFMRARHEQALKLGRELHAVAARRDPNVQIVAERAISWPLVCLDRFAEAQKPLDRIVALHRPARQRPLRFLYKQDPAATGLATGAWALWGCGAGEEADARAEEAIALARAADHPLSLVYALGVAALLAALRGDAAAA